jgi:iron complex outermembrane receptor protein
MITTHGRSARMLGMAAGVALSTGAAFGQSSVSGVVVTASPLAGDPDRFATIVQQIRRDDILRRGGASLADSLRETPGVAGSGFAVGASRPIIRGMDAQRVKIVENGYSSSDVSDIGPDHGVPIDPLAAQTIEVVRGAATLRYGSQAIGGVVNAFNNRIPMHQIRTLSGEGTAAYDSVSAARAGSVLLEGGTGDFAFHLDGFGRQSGDYETPTGPQTNSFFRGHGYSGGGSLFLDGGQDRIGGSYTRYQARYGLPADDSYIDVHQNKGAFGSSFTVGNGGGLEKIDVGGGYADYSHSEIDPEVNRALATFNNKEWDGRAEASFGSMGPLSGAAIGLQLQDRQFAALGDGADYLSPTHTRGAAGFVFVEAPLGSLSMQGAMRVERVSVDGTPASDVATKRAFTPFSASAGLTYDVSDSVRLGLTAASAARAPAQIELFARGPHDGPATFETGNPKLGIERANSIEGTARIRIGTEGKVEASLWGSHFGDYIYGALSGRLCDELGRCSVQSAGDLKEMNYTQTDARFWGAEVKGSVPLGSVGGGDLTARWLADYVRAQFPSEGANVPRIQPGRAGGGLDWTSDRIDVGFMLLQVADQTRVGVADSPTDGYTSIDLRLNWRPFGDIKKLEVLMLAQNLADEPVRNATALNKDEVMMPGRNIRLVLRTRF